MSKPENLGVIEVVSGTVIIGDPRHLKVKTEPSEREAVQLNLDNGKEGKGVVIGCIWGKDPHVFDVYGVRGDDGIAAVIVDLAGNGVENLLKPPGEASGKRSIGSALVFRTAPKRLPRSSGHGSLREARPTTC